MARPADGRYTIEDLTCAFEVGMYFGSGRGTEETRDRVTRIMENARDAAHVMGTLNGSRASMKREPTDGAGGVRTAYPTGETFTRGPQASAFANQRAPPRDHGYFQCRAHAVSRRRRCLKGALYCACPKQNPLSRYNCQCRNNPSLCETHVENEPQYPQQYIEPQ